MESLRGFLEKLRVLGEVVRLLEENARLLVVRMYVCTGCETACRGRRVNLKLCKCF